MKPVLLEVNQDCGSAWISVDGTSRAVVSGLTEGSHVLLDFGGAQPPLMLKEDGEYELPKGVYILRAVAKILKDDTVINLDLV